MLNRHSFEREQTDGCATRQKWTAKRAVRYIDLLTLSIGSLRIKSQESSLRLWVRLLSLL